MSRYPLRQTAPILVILLLAAAARIINVGHWPVWTDEGWSTWAASDHRPEVILERVSADRHPPLYFLSLSAWWTVAGDSRLALRFLSIASGLLTTALVYRIGADQFGRRAGYYAALLFAVLHIAVYYAQEIRHYSWLMLAVALMTLFFLHYLRRPRPGLLIAYALSIAFMLYSLYIGLLVLIVHIGVGLFLWRGAWRYKIRLIAAWLAAVILYIPWLIVLSRQLNLLTDGIASYPTDYASLISLSGLLLGGQLALSGGLYVIGVARIRDKVNLAPLTLVLSGVGLFGLMFIANLRVGLLSARTLVFLTPSLMLVCGYGLTLIQERARLIFAAALVIVSLSTTEIIQPRLDYQSAAQAVAADYTPGDLIILETGWDDNAFRYELMLALGDTAEPDIVRTLPWVNNRQAGQPVVPQVEGTIREHTRVWVVNWLQPSQVIPFLAGGGAGFQQVLQRETSTGTQYKALYNDSTVRAVLYERPEGKLWTYADQFRLQVNPPTMLQRGARLHIDLWWSALQSPTLDYSASVFLLDASGAVRVQKDQPPAEQPTTQWLPGKLQFDRHTLLIPPDLPPGDYSLGVKLYWYGDLKPLPVNGQPYAIIHVVKVS